MSYQLMDDHHCGLYNLASVLRSVPALRIPVPPGESPGALIGDEYCVIDREGNRHHAMGFFPVLRENGDELPPDEYDGYTIGLVGVRSLPPPDSEPDSEPVPVCSRRAVVVVRDKQGEICAAAYDPKAGPSEFMVGRDMAEAVKFTDDSSPAAPRR